MIALNWILVGILIAAGLLEIILLVTGKKTITQGMGLYNFKFPKWLNLAITISLGILAYLLFVRFKLEINPFIVAIYYLIFGHLFGRF